MQLSIVLRTVAVVYPESMAKAESAATVRVKVLDPSEVVTPDTLT